MEDSMTKEETQAALRLKITEFGEGKNAYLIELGEFQAGMQFVLFERVTSEDRGDGTMITEAFFEGHRFLLVTEV